MTEKSTAQPKIRRMEEKDLGRVVDLCHELGYPKADKELVRKNFLLGRNLESHEYYVMTVGDFVVGWMNVILRVRLEATAFLQIGTLVVDKRNRGLGYGRMFLAFAEERARAHEFTMIGLTSSAPRIGSHKFYIAAGYEKSKENYFFQKAIS